MWTANTILIFCLHYGNHNHFFYHLNNSSHHRRKNHSPPRRFRNNFFCICSLCSLSSQIRDHLADLVGLYEIKSHRMREITLNFWVFLNYYWIRYLGNRVRLVGQDSHVLLDRRGVPDRQWDRAFRQRRLCRFYPVFLGVLGRRSFRQDLVCLVDLDHPYHLN